jgi:hypothetical protein
VLARPGCELIGDRRQALATECAKSYTEDRETISSAWITGKEEGSMSSNQLAAVVVGAVLILAVMALFAWRRAVASHEDDTIHVLEDAEKIPDQVAIAKKLETIDWWGKGLTAVTVVYLIALAAFFIYRQWLQTSTSM